MYGNGPQFDLIVGNEYTLETSKALSCKKGDVIEHLYKFWGVTLECIDESTFILKGWRNTTLLE